MDHSSEVFIHRIKEVEYISGSIDFVEVKVNAEIKEGWEPIGTPVYADLPDYGKSLVQMMVKRS